jgi:hypothetical protein
MEISIGTDHTHFTRDGLGLLITAFGHTVCWMRRDGELIVDRSDGSAWHWSKKHGRWTTLSYAGKSVTA